MIEIDIDARAGALSLSCRLSAPTPGVLALFGPSGAGKTTLLRIIAGLHKPTRGRIVVDGATFLDSERALELAPEKRRIGYVFQDSRLFPHLRVRENLLYGYRRTLAEARRIHLDEAAHALGIENLLDRGAGALSGGERQRVALGRALLAQPRLILMDEPLAGVDLARKAEIMTLVKRLQRSFRAPIVYVSHDLDEVAALADYVALIEAGRIGAHGPAEDVFANMDTPLAERADARALVNGIVAERRDGLSIIKSGRGSLITPRHEEPPGSTVRLQIFARDVTLALTAPEAISTRNVLPAQVVRMRTRSDRQVLVSLTTPVGPVLSLVTQDAVDALKFRVGLSLFALVKAVAL